LDHATVVNALQAKFADALGPVLEYRAQLIIWVAPAQIVPICTYLRDEPQFQYNFLSDLSGLDRLGMQAESLAGGHSPEQANADLRFVVNYQLLSLPNKHRVWLKVGLPASDPRVQSVTGVWATANFHEREVFDLFGIIFEGHPNLKRILLPDDWEGYPLRKDYPAAYEEVEFSHNFDRIEKQKKYAKRGA
jgi:NADH-quinone oxidoreductase subunit C